MIGVQARDWSEPVRFCREALHYRPWAAQREFLRVVARGDRTVVWGTGHGVGKTSACAALICWLLATARPGTLVISSAPTNRQVELLLWREINRLWSQSETMRMLGHPRRKYIEIGHDCAAYGFSTDEPERFQGLHAPHLRIIVDEANGFPEELWIAIDACLTGDDVQLVMVGNTLEPVGRFYSVFQSGRATLLKTTARRHPNVASGRTLVPGAVTRDWIVEFEAQYGVDSEIVKARIDADFPDFSTSGLISLSDWAACATIKPRTTEPIILAVDVARYGSNLSVATLLRGQSLAWQRHWSKSSLIDTADRVGRLYRESGAQVIVVDDDGVGGGVVDILEREALPVVAFRGGLKADESERFANRIAEAYWRARELVQSGALAVAGSHDLLARQLAMRNYRLVRGGLISLETKEQYGRRTGLPSPDYADSFAMGCHELMRRWAEVAAR